jgi:hypothetical protein
MGVGGQRHAPAALPPWKTRYPLYRRLGGPQGWSGRLRKISHPPGFDSRAVQPVASRYTDWAIPAHSPYQWHTLRISSYFYVELNNSEVIALRIPWFHTALFPAYFYLPKKMNVRTIYYGKTDLENEHLTSKKIICGNRMTLLCIYVKLMR